MHSVSRLFRPISSHLRRSRFSRSRFSLPSSRPRCSCTCPHRSMFQFSEAAQKLMDSQPKPPPPPAYVPPTLPPAQLSALYSSALQRLSTISTELCSHDAAYEDLMIQMLQDVESILKMENRGVAVFPEYTHRTLRLAYVDRLIDFVMARIEWEKGGRKTKDQVVPYENDDLAHLTPSLHASPHLSWYFTCSSTLTHHVMIHACEHVRTTEEQITIALPTAPAIGESVDLIGPYKGKKGVVVKRYIVQKNAIRTEADEDQLLMPVSWQDNSKWQGLIERYALSLAEAKDDMAQEKAYRAQAIYESKGEGKKLKQQFETIQSTMLALENRENPNPHTTMIESNETRNLTSDQLMERLENVVKDVDVPADIKEDDDVDDEKIPMTPALQSAMDAAERGEGGDIVKYPDDFKPMSSLKAFVNECVDVINFNADENGPIVDPTAPQLAITFRVDGLDHKIQGRYDIDEQGVREFGLRVQRLPNYLDDGAAASEYARAMGEKLEKEREREKEEKERAEKEARQRIGT